VPLYVNITVMTFCVVIIGKVTDVTKLCVTARQNNVTEHDMSLKKRMED